MKLSIEYCTAWNYLPRAASLATEILQKYGTAVTSLKMLPSGGGVFEVTKNDSLVYSKKREGRFPEVDEIFTLLEN